MSQEFRSITIEVQITSAQLCDKGKMSISLASRTTGVEFMQLVGSHEHFDFLRLGDTLTLTLAPTPSVAEPERA